MTDWRAADTAASALGSMGRASGWTASGLKGATFPPPSTEASCLSLSPVASCGSTSTGALCPSWRHAPHWYGPVIQPISKWVIAIWLVTQNLYVDWLVVEIAGRSTPPASIKASSESGETWVCDSVLSVPESISPLSDPLPDTAAILRVILPW